MENIDIYDRFKGVIYGQAVGDALGLGTEGMTDEDIAWKYPDGLRHYSQILQDSHRSRWKIGDWTDDTDMMLCIADAVIEDGGVDFRNVAKHFKKWANGIPMGIGINTHHVLTADEYEGRQLPVCGWNADGNQSGRNAAAACVHRNEDGKRKRHAIPGGDHHREQPERN